MKNVVQIIKKTMFKASSALLILLFSVFSFTAKADITIVSASVEGGYQPGTTTTVLIDVLFDSNTAESADFIEFRTSGPIAGLSLWHGLPSPSPYQGCGLNKGNEMTNSGPGWGTPNMMSGNSGCGAFEPGEIYTFGVDVLSDGTFTGSFGIEVRAVGDGNGEASASESIAEVMVQPIVCTIVCPQPVQATAGNTCGVTLSIPAPVLNGDCGTQPSGVTQEFPVGETEVVYSSIDGNNNVIRCSTLVTVVDDTDPFIVGVQNLDYDLNSGGCGVVIPQTFTVNENCIEPARFITQNNDLSGFDAGYNCIGGPTKYLRVFDADDENVDTELNIEEITFGVLEAYGDPYVTVNVYRVNGTPTYANMELLGTGNDILPDFQDGLYSIPVTATIERGETFAVEIVVPGSQFNGVIMAMNQAGESAPSYVASDFCGIPEPTTLSSAGYPGYASIIAVEGYETSYIVVPVNGSATIGDTAYIGETQVQLLAIDASGNEANIGFTVNVNEFTDVITAIVCNDEVQISLDDNCEAVITAALVLEGGPYACFDNYAVEIEDDNGNKYGDLMTEENIGQNLTVKVTDPNGNSCWGTLIVEDKNPTPLECIDVSTTCIGSTFPGAPIADMVSFPANLNTLNEVISENGVGAYPYTFSVNGLVKSTITKVALRLNVEHTSVSDLNATLSAPDGTTVTLFVAPGTTCDEDNIQITLDDAAFNTYNDLESACDTISPAISGAYKPQQLLNIFNGKDPNGDWTLTVSDTKDGDGGTVIAAELVISQQGGVVSFPTPNDILTQTEGDYTYTVMGIDACGPATLTYNDFIIDQDCSSPYSQVIQRTWNAVDESGNQSEGCVQTIYVYRNGLATLTFPPNYDDIQQPSLSCSDFADEVPPTSVTGMPTGDLCDNVQMFPHQDTRIEVCEGSYKIVRYFQLLEWCSGEVVEHNQIIKVVDKEGPELEDMQDITISAGEYDCFADYVVVYPEVLFDCSDEFTYEVSTLAAFDGGSAPEDEVYYSDNVSTSGSTTIIKDLPYGRTWVKVRVGDECGNYSEEFFTLTVDDQVNPIAVCDEFTTVSIGSDGYVDVFATTFDDGSLDNCGIESMQARKMTNQCSGVSTSFSDRVTFCCEEVGETIMVAFEVTDLSGNKNTCMVEVTVQDKLPPYITECPEDITLDCQADYSDLLVTGEPEFIDNCEVVSVSFVDNEDIDNCGSGLVRRTWTVEDKEGFKATCVQRIYLEDDDPFVENDINWPRDYDATTCDTNLDPENLPVNNAYPRYDDDNCSLVATVYEDKEFTFVDGACEKILREWTVIDWCTYNENNPVEGEGLYKHLQVIKLINNEAPVVDNCIDTEVEVFGECEGEVEYTLEATDDCTPEEELVFEYQIDIDSDGLDALDLNLKGNSATFKRTLPIGTHTVNWAVADKCGNVEYCEMVLTVVDGKLPSPYCLSSITTVVMNNSGEVEVWANDFDYGSYDNCTPLEELIFSFSSNVNETSKTFSCDDMPNGEEEEVQVELWVTDNAGNQDYCSITLILQDSQDDVCEGIDNGNFASISGEMITESFGQLEGVTVNTYSPAIEVYETAITNNQGQYNSTNLPKGPGYIVTATKNDDVNNGVSTLDLVLIQRHILGLNEFTSAYNVIASDINDDEKVNAADLLSLRKVILGVISEFPNGQESWRFIPQGTTFTDVSSPWGFPEEINIGDLQYTSLNNDMIAVKIGDVNGNASTNLQGDNNASVRSGKAMKFVVENNRVEEGESVEIPVYAEDIDNMVGLQFTMNLDGASFNTVIAGQLDMTENNFNVDRNAIASSWNDYEGLEINESEPLFTIVLDATVDGNIAELISITNEMTTSEGYDNDLNTYDIVLETRSDEIEEGKFALFQNRPNPFMESTEIKFFLPEATKVELLITDVTGKLVTRKVQEYTAGTQSMIVNYNDLNVSGVLYYTIKAGGNIATKKMINVR